MGPSRRWHRALASSHAHDRKLQRRHQRCLSAFDYHRWHAPVAGLIREAYNVDGTYYSNAEAQGPDPGGLNHSQGYTTAVAARAVIVIDCDDVAIGAVACVFVGMAEVSSCRIVALPGQHVDKGDELGCFQYGGSTWCAIFRPGVIDQFVPQPHACFLLYPGVAARAQRVDVSVQGVYKNRTGSRSTACLRTWRGVPAPDPPPMRK